MKPLATVIVSAAAAAAAAAAVAAPPHVVMIVADDLGYADVGCMGASDVRTPHIDALHARGRRIERYYGQPVCSPSRAALHTGRLPLALGLQTYVIDPTGVDYGLDLNETTLPQLLRDRAGYRTHAVGKYHLGMARWAQTPTFRGYDSFHGFYSGGQDYFTHQADGGFDMHIDSSRECGANCSVVDWASAGVYSTHLYTRAAVDVIRAHPPAQPLFLYLAYQAVHSPDQVPESYIAPYNASISDPKRRTFAGMLSCLDEGVGNVTTALEAAGLAANTLVVFVSDNGGPIRCEDGPCGDATGTSNWPLRAGKHSVWEGGVRLTAIVGGPMVAAPYGTNLSTGLFHHADWLPTLLEAAGVAYEPAPGFELHGASQWAMLTRGAASSRNETVANIDPMQPAVGAKTPPGQGNAAIITADGMKLILGLAGPPDVYSPPNASLAAALGLDGAGSAAPLAAAAAAAAGNCSAAFSEGVCLPGFSLPGHASPVVVADARACCALCAPTAGCALWTLNHVTGAKDCWLKSAGALPVPGPTCVSSPGEAPAPFAVWPLKNMTAQLFNLTVDPYERDDVSALHPELVARLTARLAQWGSRARDPYWRTATVDPKSDPSLRNGSWIPWLD